MSRRSTSTSRRRANAKRSHAGAARIASRAGAALRGTTRDRRRRSVRRPECRRIRSRRLRPARAPASTRCRHRHRTALRGAGHRDRGLHPCGAGSNDRDRRRARRVRDRCGELYLQPRIHADRPPLAPDRARRHRRSRRPRGIGMSIYNAAWAIPLLPLLGALGSLGVETQRRAAQLCVFFTSLSFVVAAIILGVRLTHAPASPFVSLLTFFAMTPPEGATFTTQFTAQVGVQVDALSASFAAAIAFATVVIQAYAVNAMRGAHGVRRFFCASSVLAFCTTGFVLSPNLFDSLILWVGASATLYVLLSLTWQQAETARRAMRAMVVLTAGDIALTLGVVFTWIKFGVF